ncbi:MAG: helix-turn-helix transcriptional regulator [Candidatus Pacebacteria bacterium]|nr:helix-turn-helix transcriptional regulator [Candidatus Paceibacterota bacterium]
MKTLGQYIREERDRMDISLREFAKKIDCSPAFISDIELGKRNPSEEVFKKIASALSVSDSKLKEYDTRPPTDDFRSSTSDPRMAFAFRSVLEKGVTPEELIKFANKISKINKDQKRSN